VTARLVLGAVGVALTAYGGWLAVSRQDTDQLVEIGVWVVAGILLHDVVLAGVVLVAGWLGRRVLPPPWQGPAALALLVWGSLTVMAIPVLGRFGARPDNPTLLDRPYLGSWLALTVAAMAVTAVAGVVRGRSRSARG
jgi:hypothetical protein